MASSSVSQEEVDPDFELSSRRSRIRTARARNINPPSRIGDADDDDGVHDGDSLTCGNLHTGLIEHDISPKPTSRIKEKRVNSRPAHTNKGKQQRDRRKLREKRRSTGVVHLPSTESTGGSTGEDEELVSVSTETRRNTHYNENLSRKSDAAVASLHEAKHKKGYFSSARNKSPSDLEADDEDNQDYDSLPGGDTVHSRTNKTGESNSGSNVSSVGYQKKQPATNWSQNGRPSTPTSSSVEELFESARQENLRLLEILDEKEHRIVTLETKVSQLNSQLHEAQTDRSTLRQENLALIRTMAALTTK